MKTTRKAQESSCNVREAFKKRCRARRSSASSPTASPSVLDSDSEAARRRPRLSQLGDTASCDKDEKSSTSSTVSSNEESASRSGAPAGDCTLSKSGSPKYKNSASENAGHDPVAGSQQELQNSKSSLPLFGESDQTIATSRSDKQKVVGPPDRVHHHAILVEKATPESLQTSLTSEECETPKQRPRLFTVDKEKSITTHSTPDDCQVQQLPPSASNGIPGTSEDDAFLEVVTDNHYGEELNGQKRALSAKLDDGGQTPQKRTGPANVLQILLSKQLPSCTASALSILEKGLREKIIYTANETCGAGKPVVEGNLAASQEVQSEDEERENMETLTDERHVVTTDEAINSSRVPCCSSNPSALHLQTAPPLYYTVLTNNSLHTKHESVGTKVYVEEQVDHDTYPVVKGVSRDNTKKRWAVYWKGSRKYFYDKCYADCHQAYLSAVEFRRQAKACNAPGPPPKRPALQSEFYLSAPASSLRFTSYSPGITSFPTAPSTPPAFSACDGPSPCTAVLGKCGPAAINMSAAVSEYQVGSTGLSELSVSFNEKEAVISRCDRDPSISSPTTADSCENLTDTVQVYRCAVIILLQDLLYEVLPPRIATLGPTRRASPSDPPLKARAEERFLSASLQLLQRTLQGHISKAERGGEEDLTQLLSILMPSLDRQLLPSELPRELQQTMLLQLTTLRL